MSQKEHPASARFRALLRQADIQVRALSRSGRQTEALALRRAVDGQRGSLYGVQRNDPATHLEAVTFISQAIEDLLRASAPASPDPVVDAVEAEPVNDIPVATTALVTMASVAVAMPVQKRRGRPPGMKTRVIPEATPKERKRRQAKVVVGPLALATIHPEFRALAAPRPALSAGVQIIERQVVAHICIETLERDPKIRNSLTPHDLLLADQAWCRKEAIA